MLMQHCITISTIWLLNNDTLLYKVRKEQTGTRLSTQMTSLNINKIAGRAAGYTSPIKQKRGFTVSI